MDGGVNSFEMSAIEQKSDIKLEYGFENNPWSVEDASAFLKYCCPECDYSNKNLPSFSKHALKNHVLANTLFNNDNDNSENQIVTIVKSEDQENFKSEVTDDHNDIDTTVIKDEPITYDDGKLMKLSLF